MKNTRIFPLMILIVLAFVAGPAMASRTHTMTQGDTLWDLSLRFFGDPSLYPVFLEVNGITNPRTIPTGKMIIVPSYDEIRKIAAEPDPPRRRELISRVQGEAGVTPQPAPTAHPMGRRPIDPRNVTLQRMLTGPKVRGEDLTPEETRIDKR